MGYSLARARSSVAWTVRHPSTIPAATHQYYLHRAGANGRLQRPGRNFQFSNFPAVDSRDVLVGIISNRPIPSAISSPSVSRQLADEFTIFCRPTDGAPWYARSAGAVGDDGDQIERAINEFKHAIKEFAYRSPLVIRAGCVLIAAKLKATDYPPADPGRNNFFTTFQYSALNIFVINREITVQILLRISPFESGNKTSNKNSRGRLLPIFRYLSSVRPCPSGNVRERRHRGTREATRLKDARSARTRAYNLFFYLRLSPPGGGGGVRVVINADFNRVRLSRSRSSLSSSFINHLRRADLPLSNNRAAKASRCFLLSRIRPGAAPSFATASTYADRVYDAQGCALCAISIP